MASLVDWITNKLEEVDNHAAAAAATKDVVKLDNDVDPAVAGLEASGLRQSLLMAKEKTTALEEQVRRLERLNVHLEGEVSDASAKASQATERMQKMEIERDKLRSTLKSIERKQAQDAANFEKTRQGFEDLREKLERELAAVSQELSTSQQEVSVQKNENARLEADLKRKTEEILALEGEVSKFRENAMKALQIETSDSSVSAQLEVLENERNRLKEKLAKEQQRIVQLEAAGKELEGHMQSELGDAKRQQTSLESELFKMNTQKEAMSHEIALLKAQLAASQEAAESKYKMQLIAERNQHRQEVARLKEEFHSTTRDGKSTEEQLLSALAAVDALKSEKEALMVMLDAQKTGLGEQPMIMNVESQPKRPKMVSIATVVPRSAPTWVRYNLLRAEGIFGTGIGYLGRNPAARLVFVIWIVFLHLHFLF